MMTASQEGTRGGVLKKALLACAALTCVFLAVFIPVYITQINKQTPAQLRSSDQQCAGFQLPAKEQGPPKFPKTDKRPNFIYLFLDDQGYDDLGLHHPQGGMHNYITTPNMDRLVREGMEMTNFYTTPMCTTSRAELLTGRYYPRTGSMYINTGWDFMNVNETNIAEIMAGAGYKTAVFGKWHNGRTAGYQPVDVGFQHAVMPTPYVHYDNLVYINGAPVQTKGWMEEVVMGMAIDYLKRRDEDDQPFFMYYPTFSVHAGWMTSNFAGQRYQRPAPQKYLDKYKSKPLSDDTAHLYAMLEHIDDQIGRLMRFLDKSGLAENTYIFIGGDNGPALFQNEAKPLPRVVRMPSGMQGAKHSVKEGGVRNYLAVRGPGVAQGSSSDALLGLIDIVPTVVELAGIEQVVAHDPWDGISFANILAGQEPTNEQQQRLLFSMETSCIEDDFVPALGPDRWVEKPQDLLSYTGGGVSGLGFKRCMAVRFRDYKWVADAGEIQGQGPKYMSGNKELQTGLYRFRDGLHIELGCQEVSRTEPKMSSYLESAAEQWFAAMLNSRNSFQKPTFFLGLRGRAATNIVADGAIQRTRGRIQVLPMGLAGFVREGDSAWYRLKVTVAGTYKISIFYQSNHQSGWRVWVGPHELIEQGNAMHLDARLPASPDKRTNFVMGQLTLPKTGPGIIWELKLELTGNTGHLKPAMQAVDTIFLKRVGAPGIAVAYDPDSQEGVKTWKIAHGYNNIQGGH